MERSLALERLRLLLGKDVRLMTDKYEVTVWEDGKINKGWFGHTVERYLGLPINSSQSPNFGSWELKTVPVRRLKDGRLVPKETMAITMIDPFNIKHTAFEESHLLSKLRKMVVCVRMFESSEENSSALLGVVEFDLGNKELFDAIK